MCDFCKIDEDGQIFGKYLINSSKACAMSNFNVEVNIIGPSLYIDIKVGNSLISDYDIVINYCPICGRKIK